MGVCVSTSVNLIPLETLQSKRPKVTLCHASLLYYQVRRVIVSDVVQAWTTASALEMI